MQMRTILTSTVGVIGLWAASSHTPASGAVERVDELVHAAMRLDVNPKRGQRIFEKQCVACHGAKAHGDPARDVPALAGQRQSYIVKQLADFSEMERASSDMHAVATRAGVSEPQDWVDVAAYVNSLPPIPNPRTGDGRYVNLGEAIFRQHCASCHEEDARGDDEGFVPSLRNQHYAYLLSETRTMARWHARNIEPDLARFLDSLDEDEMRGVADYLSRQRGPVRDRATLRDDGSVKD